MKSLNENSSKALGYLSFLILPILSLFIAIKNYKSPWAKNILWFFIAFYAYHFAVPGEGVDIVSYIERFELYRTMELSFQNFIISLYAEGSTTLDVLEPLLSFTLSKFTENYKVLLLFYGIIYGYFYSRNIWYLLDELKGKIKFRTIIILFLVFATIAIWEINGFRFWCGAHIFIYASYNLLILKKNKGFFFLALATLMHLGMIIPVIICLIFKYFKTPSIRLLFPIFLFTFFFAELDLEVVRNFIGQYTPGFMQQKITDYTSAAYSEGLTEKYDSYSFAYQLSQIVGLLLKSYFILILYLNRNLLLDATTGIIFKFFLFFGIFANLIMQIPSGGRYSLIASFLLYSTLLIFVQNNNRYKLGRLLPSFIPLILVYVVYQARIIGFDTFSIHHLINNPIISFFIS
jgi:hypothetical protein